MMKMAVGKVTGVFRGLLMYWVPTELRIDFYVCMGTGDNYLAKKWGIYAGSKPGLKVTLEMKHFHVY